MSYQLPANGFTVAIDRPAADVVLSQPFVHITGWVASTGPLPTRLCLVGGGGAELPVHMFDRPDVVATLPGHRVTGFDALVASPDLLGAAPVRLRVGQSERFELVDLPLRFEVASVQAIADDLPRRRERVRSVLACANGCAGDLAFLADHVHCPACGTRWPMTQGRPDLRSGTLRRAIDGGKPAAVSSNGYDPIAWSIINRLPNGLILDNGAGLRDRYLPNVVNLEIAALPGIDVLGVGEHLPFKDNSFDAVFSFAVLEHVRDPFACANEIARVLKPGGTLYAAVPFLQPFHGYPDHYYNMTSHGLRNLFERTLRIDEMGVPDSGKPFWALNWMLRSYVEGLPAEVAERFRTMTVNQLLGDPVAHLVNDYVRGLSAAADEELACVNYLIATKP